MDAPRLFALGARANLACLPGQVLGRPLIKLDADANARFARLLNVINGYVYGGVMGMPEWVMLDCALLPSMFIGQMGPGRLLSRAQRDGLDAALRAGGGDPITDDEPVPLAEFCAIPAVAPETVVAFSLYSLLAGQGPSTKAYGLAAHRALGARWQLGVAQYDKPTAIRTHSRFGRLQLLRAVTPLHSRADVTFVYRLAIPDEGGLQAVIDGERARAEAPNLRLRAEDVGAAHDLDARIRAGAEAWIVPPGTAGRGVDLEILIHETREP